MKKLKVGADPFPPYQYFNENREVKGTDYEYIKAVLKKMGYGMDMELDDWCEIASKFDEKKLDLCFQVTPTDQRRKKWLFSNVFRYAVTNYITAGDIQAKNFSTFAKRLKTKEKKLGLIKGYTYKDEVLALEPDYTVYFSTFEELCESVNNAKTEVGIVDQGVFNWLGETHDYKHIKAIKELEYSRPVAVIFNDIQLRNAFNENM